MRLFRTVLAILREIFEESAYERFCEREQTGASRESYARFLKETAQARRQKISCC